MTVKVDKPDRIEQPFEYHYYWAHMHGKRGESTLQSRIPLMREQLLETINSWNRQGRGMWVYWL